MLTRDQIRTYIDKLGIPSHLDQEGDICVSFYPDKDFPHAVEVSVVVQPERISYIAFPSNYHPDDLEFKVNRLNRRRNFPTAVIVNGSLRMEYSFLITEDVSEEYISDTCVRQILASIWNAFVEFEQEDN